VAASDDVITPINAHSVRSNGVRAPPEVVVDRELLIFGEVPIGREIDRHLRRQPDADQHVLREPGIAGPGLPAVERSLFRAFVDDRDVDPARFELGPFLRGDAAPIAREVADHEVLAGGEQGGTAWGSRTVIDAFNHVGPFLSRNASRIAHRHASPGAAYTTTDP
jgi:hypothetical protein